MAYTDSIYLFGFLPGLLFLYQITPRRFRWIPLLTFSYVFFILLSGKLLVFLMGATAFTYGIGEWLIRLKAKKADKKIIKRVLVAGIVVMIGLLAYLKYYNFFVENANSLMHMMGFELSVAQRTLMVPIGISFYTLEAIGYMVDVYWGKIKEQNFWKLALFLGFFPQIMEGPIALYEQTADSLWEGKPLTVDNLAQGAIRITWGMFKKIIIADRLNVLVGGIFDNYTEYHGAMIAVAAVAYTIQLYNEFSGTMDIILGSGQMFGVMLPENFRQPFFAHDAGEFWRRWHITLGVWFKTYIFYPVSVSKTVKKWNKYGRKHLNKYITKLVVSALGLFPVWICNGLWHGPRWNYIFYGIYYFVILMLEVAVEPVKKKIVKKCKINEKDLWFRALRVLKTWIIIFTGELFFRAETLTMGMTMFKNLFVGFDLSVLYDGTLLGFDLNRADYMAIGFGIVVVAIVDTVKEKQLLGNKALAERSTPVRWAVYYALIVAVVLLGAYGIGYQQVDLIYAGF